jgi:hypothetical protein
MARSLKGTILFVALTLVLLFVFVSSAFAISITSTEVQQASPGMTVRTIWGQAQVYQYPIQINHVGYAHVELTFQPTWASADLYVYGPNRWDTSGTTIGYQYINVNQGYLGGYSWGLPSNKDYVDFKVTYINNQIKDPTIDWVKDRSGGFVGDTYYILIVAFDDVCRTQLWGYVPTVDQFYAEGAHPMDPWQILKAFRFPQPTKTNPNPWKTVNGTPYGQPFDFAPTSMGTESIAMQWPADVVAKTISGDHAAGNAPSEYESYLYNADWSTTIANDYEGSGGASGWYPPTWSATEAGITSPWYGYYEPITVQEPVANPDAGLGTAPAGKMQHWVPSLGIVAANPVNGPALMLPEDPANPGSGLVDPALTSAQFVAAGPLTPGLRTVGYEGIINLPQNLTINTKTVSVKKGASVTIMGQLAYDSGAGVVFPPTPQSVKIQQWLTVKGVKKWVTVKTVMSGTDGKFSAKVVPTMTTSWHAICTPSPAPNPATSLLIETSLIKKINVHL